MDTCFFEQVFIVVRTFAFGAYALRTLAFMNISVYCRPYICFYCICFWALVLFLNKFLLSSIHLLLEHMLYGYLLIFTQVLIVVHTHAFSTCVSWALACWYKCFLSSMHMLFVHMFHGHLLFGTSAFCCMYFSLSV